MKVLCNKFQDMDTHSSFFTFIFLGGGVLGTVDLLEIRLYIFLSLDPALNPYIVTHFGILAASL